MFFKVVLTLALASLASANIPWVPIPRPNVTWWMPKHEALLNQTRHHAVEVKVVFLGDSIIEQFARNGKKVWQEHYAPRHAFNYGLGGDRTEYILWRIAHGEFDNVHPKLIVLKIGKWGFNLFLVPKFWGHSLIT